MNLIPTKTQWNGWTLPSKASYIGCVIGILALIVTVIIAVIQSSHDKTENQPQLAVNFSGKPYLRYSKIGDSGMEFSYEICIKNSGKNPAAELVYKKTIQTMVVDGRVVAKTNSKNSPPNRLVSGDHYCQIFSIKNTDMTSKQIDNCIQKYSSEDLAIILDLEIEYSDAITGKRYKMNECNKVFLGRVNIL